MKYWIQQTIFKLKNPEIKIELKPKKPVKVKDSKQFVKVKKLIKTSKGYTKENHPGIAQMSQTITGRNKNNHPGKAAQAEKKRKLPLDQHSTLILMKQNKVFSREIQAYFKELGFEIGQDQINKLYRSYLDECKTKKS
jgi:hypothetical protein